MTIVLTGGTVVPSLHPPIVEPADVVLEGGRVAAVGVGVPRAADRRSCAGCLVVPGNVNGHTHLYSALARGMPYQLEPPRTFIDILRRVWWRLDRALDHGTIRASALVAGMDALLAGTTTVVDHHASPNAADGSLDIIADALAELGLRSVLCYETSDRDGPRIARAGLAENVRFLREGAGRRYPLARGLVGAHASFTLSAETLDGCADAARAAGVGLHIHLAEDGIDERDCLARFGVPVVDRLASSAALDARGVLAHGVHLSPGEVEHVRAASATVVHNPSSNMHNGVGRPRLGELGDAVALGTDGLGPDLFAETRTAYLRRREEDVTIGPGWGVDRLVHSARLAGTAFDEPLLGRIEPGAPADLLVLDVHPPTPLTADGLAGHWVLSLSSSMVRDVFVAGEPVVLDRRLVNADAERIAEDARHAAARLWSSLETVDVHPFTAMET